MVSLKSVRGDGAVLYLVGAVGEMQGDSRNGITFGLDLDSGVVCPTLKPWKWWGGCSCQVKRIRWSVSFVIFCNCA